jgi:hypothetical protein
MSAVIAEAPEAPEAPDRRPESVKRSGKFKKWAPGIHIFTASWCGWCKKMKAGNMKFAAAMSQSTPSPPHTLVQTTNGIKVICHELTTEADKLDAEVNKFSVTGYPSVYFKLPSGAITEYSGGRIICNADAAPIFNEKGGTVPPPSIDMIRAYERASA